MTLPSLFLSHGAPTLPLTDTPARTFLQQLGQTLERPKAILVISAHWETAVPTVSAVDSNATIHDFGGFSRALYDLRYPAPGSPALAARVAEQLHAGGFNCNIDKQRGLDHGAWVPLLLMYPQADIPVLQVSVQPRLGPEHHLRVGRALAALRDEGVLIVGSGSFTHDLSEFRGHGPNDAAPDWVNSFADWFDAALTKGQTGELLDYRRRAPFAARTTRPKNISCRCMRPWARPERTLTPNGFTPVRPTACCGWMCMRFNRAAPEARKTKNLHG
jgi:4,5-DOPA dioxygenase extradiol